MTGEDICICSHRRDEHHRSWFPGGFELVEECEHYSGSFDETGGMMPTDNGWYDHCFRYELDKEANNGQTSKSSDRKANNRNQD